MIYEVFDNLGAKIKLGDAMSVKIVRDIDVPADALYATFAIRSSINELKYIKVYESDKLVFNGIIDEQNIEYSDDGCFLKISSRDITSLLIDNEALPQNYEMPSLGVIFDRHIKPYGFTDFLGNERPFSSTFTVYKGMSEWDVLENFCYNFLGTHPKVINNTTIDATGLYSSSNTINIDNKSGVLYKSINYKINRYKRISEVFIRTNKDGAYDVRTYDQSAIDSSIKRKRYLNAFNDTRTPVSFGEDMIKNSKAGSYIFTAKCIGNINASVGAKATINDPIIGNIQDLIISKVIYSLKGLDEITEISMRRGE